MNELKVVEQENSEIIQTVDIKIISEFLDTTGLTKTLLPKEKSMFINMAQMYGLNPFKREIYCTVYGENTQYRQCSIVTGYEVYLKRAERIGKLDGWTCSIKGSVENGDLEATVVIHRKDWEHEFYHTAYYEECVQINKKTNKPNAIWAKMPRFMTKKVAIAQAFRLCFSDEFGGMPYTNDEMGVEVPVVEERNITSEKEPETVSFTVEDDKTDYLGVLLDLIDGYEDKLQGKPLELAKEALHSNDKAQIKAMVERVRSYLSKKGLKVA